MRAALFIALIVVALVGEAAGQPFATPALRYEQERADRDERDRTIWSAERAAVRHEQYFVKLWDDVRSAADTHEPFRRLAFGGLRLPPPWLHVLDDDGTWRPPRALGPGGTYNIQQVHELLGELEALGIRLEQCEWHHDDFRVDDEGRATSTLSMILHAGDADGQNRYQVHGTLNVEWASTVDDEDRVVPRLIDVTALDISQWIGSPVFQPRFTASLEHASPMDDLLVYDLNGDGLSDFAYPSSNQVFFNEGGFRFREEMLCVDPPKLILESVFADFTGDGFPDFLCAGVTPIRFTMETRMRLFLYAGDGTGRFTAPARRLGAAELQFLRPDCFAVGDVDGDADLDVWVSQYMAPYLNGQFPEPYYDSNDGYPSYLLLNDGTGGMTDATEAAGLAAKRFRRTFRSSFVDLDDDRDLDLVVVSDFAGLDIHENDGSGRFTDVTDSIIDDPSSFGMSHTFGDFDADGRLDLYVTGMGSTTARRLDRMGLGRPDRPEFDEMRLRIGYGNRMYLAGDDGRLHQPGFKDDVARSGWAWGCASLDFDSDGDPDIYVSNGNQSGRSAQDYCTTFWCHDIYTGSSKSDPALNRVFSDDLKLLQSGRISWNGYEHNHLFMNDGDDGFRNVAYLMGVALEADCRATVADDFDLDGRPDLLVVAFDRRGRWPRRVVNVFQNTWGQANNWIGVRLRGAPGVSPIGARVLLVHAGGRQVDAFVTGDSAKSQHAHLKHFGLNGREQVEYLEVRWPDGTAQRIDAPAINTYHDLTPPS